MLHKLYCQNMCLGDIIRLLLVLGRRDNMTKVEVSNGNIDGALRRFKMKVARSGVPSELKKRKHYEKPGVRKRNEKKEMIKNARKNNRKNY